MSRSAAAPLLVAGALAAAAAASWAQPVEYDITGASLALPILTDPSGRHTYATVTSLSTSARVLRLTLIDGLDWSGVEYSCAVTAQETTLLVLDPTPLGSLLSFECTDPGTGQPVAESEILTLREGILFVSLLDAEGKLLVTENTLLGDAIVVDYLQGNAYAFEAIPFVLGPSALGLADRVYRFDGANFAEFPATLISNFIAPTSSTAGSGTTAELVLFTLDGTIGDTPGPSAFLNIYFYNADEVIFTSQYQFDCFDVVPLMHIDARFERFNLATNAGLIELTPQLTLQANTNHDESYDGGAGDDGVRKTPVLGWLVQGVWDGGDVVAGGSTMGLESGLWGRVLQPSAQKLIAANGDTPTLDATSIPEPGGILMLAAGVAFLATVRGRRRG